MITSTIKLVRIGDRLVGPGHPIFIIAEMSANHGQNFDRAVEIIKAAKAAGADAIKVQTYTPDTMTIDSDRPEFRHEAGSLWAGKAL
ncbi:MAG: N-acetylneuraminate synthase family protein, partial [Acidobacteriota bacterium]